MKKITWLLLSIIMIVVGIVGVPQYFSGYTGRILGWILYFILIIILFGFYMVIRSFYRQIRKGTNIPEWENMSTIEWLLLSIIMIVAGVVQYFSGASGWIFGFILIVALIFGLYIMLRSFYRQIKKRTNISVRFIVRFIVGWVLTILGFFGFFSGRYHDYGYGPQGALYLFTLIVIALFGLYMVFDSIKDEFKKSLK